MTIYRRMDYAQPGTLVRVRMSDGTERRLPPVEAKHLLERREATLVDRRDLPRILFAGVQHGPAHYAGQTQ